MRTKVTNHFIQKYDLNLGTYYFYENYFVAEINEGEVINLEKLSDLIPIVLEHYGDGRPFTYISDRINSHAITPIDYLNCPLISMENFRGYAVVTYNKAYEMSIHIEKHFAQRPFFYFNNLQDATDWSKEVTTLPQ
ncbi:hypothetical protein [Aquimarina sp. RZ0]|uniref:hypothetical protein n=1 Tax=Aquimarina sp. RZ0 TaxID=2607730 RepID=UPI0011F3AB4C|nr:hypothetical protein [Aquimarina sp. RZ0]KAA1246685.1 hypothetical protein F0000_06485 [Aquimarina sp. RZ0]